MQMTHTMNTKTADAFLELVNLYPSPHNGQPITMHAVTDGFELFFEKQRGLQSAPISLIFSFVSMGVFVEHMALCARALGHGFSYKLNLPGEASLKGEGTLRFASVKLAWNSKEPVPSLATALRFRQTSRKKYYAGVEQTAADGMQAIAARANMRLVPLTDKQTTQTIWLNQRAVFDDMFDEPVRRELDHWLRYTQAQKQATQDGLAYDCMELNGRAMQFIVRHPALLRAPGVAWCLQRYYMRTMQDSSNAFCMLAPFANESQAFEVGTVIMRIWIELSRHGYYLHPFGTIMSNAAAHRDFVKMAHITSESRDASYLVFIFRGGKSDPPVRSLRRDYHKHLIRG